jgi:hypothetical protein
MANGYCPHCGLVVEHATGSAWPSEPTRCPHCRLLIGVARGRDEPGADPGAKGAAAGVLSRQARRDEGASEPPDPDAADEILAAIRAVAGELGTRPERLLMIDYQQRAQADPAVPPLRDVFAHFQSWKRARQRAAEVASR